MANNTVEICENCGRVIGKLETPMVWNGHVVCKGCRDALAAEREAPRGRATAEGHSVVREPPEVLPGDTVLDVTAGMPDYRAAPSLQDFQNAARRGTPGLSPRDAKDASFRAGWKNLLLPITGFAIVAAVLAGMHLFAGHNSAELRAAEVKAYGALNAIGPWERGQQAEDSDCRRAEAALAVVAANDGGTPTRIEKLLGNAYSFLSLSRSEADDSSQLVNVNLQASGAGIPPVKGASADLASSSADWDRGLECLRRAKNLLRR